MTTLALSTPIQSYVGAFVLRRRRLALLKAAGRAVAFSLVWMLLWCMADRFLQLPGGVRLAMLCIHLAAVVALLGRPTWHVLFGRTDWVSAAGQIERHDSRFAQRLQTVTSQLLSPPAQRGSPEILEQLQREVDEQAAGADPRALIPGRLVAGPWLISAAAVVLMAALMPLAWLDLPRLMLRYLRPLSDLPPVTTTRLSVSPGSADVVQGEPLEIAVQAQRLGESSLTLHLSFDGQSWARSAMVPRGPEQFAFTISAVDRDMRYYVSGGDAASSVFDVRVLRRPAVAEFRVRYTYPAYTGRPPLSISNTDGLIEAPVGTEAVLMLHATEPLTDASLVIEGQRIATSATIDPNVRQVKLDVQKDQEYQVQLLSTRNVSGEGPKGTVIRAVPDRPPLVRLLQPSDDVRLHPRDILSVHYQALDDYGIGSLSALVQVNSSPPRQTPFRLRGDSRRQEGVYNLDLAGFELKIGDVVSVSLTAQDKAGQSATSDARHILISPRSIDLSTHLRIAELKTAAALAVSLVEEYDAAIKAVDEARRVGHQAQVPFLSSMAMFNQRLAGASELAVLLRLSLGRAIMRSSSPELSVALANLIDGVQQLVAAEEAVTMMLSSAPAQTDTPRQRVAVCLEQSRQLQQHTQIIAQGEQATALLADHANLLATEKAATPSASAEPGTESAAAAERLTQTLQRTREDIASGAKELSINPQAADLDAQFQAKINQATALLKSQKPVDFAAHAKTWADTLPDAANQRLVFDQRLAAAAQAEALRPDADLIRARDLQLSGRAAAMIHSRATVPGAATQPVVTDPQQNYPPAMASLQAEHDLNRRPNDVLPPEQLQSIRTAATDARRKMALWAGDIKQQVAGDEPPPERLPGDRSAEELALEASAQAAAKNYDKAKELDEALAGKLAAAPAPPGAEAPADAGASPADPPPPEQAIDQAMQRAQELDRLSAEQKTLREQTQSAASPTPPADQPPPPPVGELASRQEKLAQAIDQLEQEEDRSWDEEPWDKDPDAREEAADTLVWAQERLAAMPQELSEVQKSSAAHRESVGRMKQADQAATAAHEAAKAPQAASKTAQQQADQAAFQAAAARANYQSAAQKSAAAQEAARLAPPAQAPSLQQQATAAANEAQTLAQQSAQASFASAEAAAKAASASTVAQQATAAATTAQRTADEARKQSLEAERRLTDASKPVEPGVAETMSARLSKFAPETSAATTAIDQQLLPSLRLLQQAKDSSDAAAVDRATAQARQAIEKVQGELRRAQDALMERDPLVAARAFAQAASDALRREPPNYVVATQHQLDAQTALTQAWGGSIQQAASLRLSALPSMGAWFNFGLPIEGSGAGSGSGRAGAAAVVPGVREWGRFQTRQPEGLSASVHESDPPEFQESLRIYFEALGHGQAVKK